MGGMLLPPVQDTHGTQLPPRYTIRPIDAGVIDWAKALAVQGFLLGPSIWEPLMAAPKTRSALRAFDALHGYYMHAVNSGVSYGVFDSEYEFARAESTLSNEPAAATTTNGEGASQHESSGGAVYWHELDPDTEPDFETGGGARRMIEGMDFPLVCVALSCDLAAKPPPDIVESLYTFFPLQKGVSQYWRDRDPRPKGTWEPQGPGEVAARMGCVTKPEYQGRGLMSALNHFVMLDLKARGFRAMNAGIGVPSVYRSWMNAPAGCRSYAYLDVNIWEIEVEDEDGRKVEPYVDSGVAKEGWLMWCDLNV
ncbi:hypothetical protein PG993_000558 [Apiospora rasikravindrae]|uniref:N-acetyltransferase domain-containing protein n=1 Tax=Apiospora rasikravindrae TaxID=990691 RepID=A0ABR1U8W6_9PEZI